MIACILQNMHEILHAFKSSCCTLEISRVNHLCPRFMQTVALLNLAGPDGAKAGLALGTATSAGLIALYLKRALDTGWSTACFLLVKGPVQSS